MKLLNVIHYSPGSIHKAICGHLFDMDLVDHFMTDDPASVDCEQCLATDEMLAMGMEDALIDLIDSRPPADDKVLNRR